MSPLDRLHDSLVGSTLHRDRIGRYLVVDGIKVWDAGPELGWGWDDPRTGEGGWILDASDLPVRGALEILDAQAAASEALLRALERLAKVSAALAAAAAS